MRLKYGIMALACVSLYGSAASAYPTSVIFAPTGDAKAAGDVGTLLYFSMILTKPVSPGLCWFGADIGVLPKLKLGDSGLSFGGLEVGVDGIVSDLLGTP